MSRSVIINTVQGPLTAISGNAVLFDTNTGKLIKDAGFVPIGASTSDILTNKTINGSLNTISNISLISSVTAILPSLNGGTGINNGSNTITLGGNLTTIGITSLSGTNTGDQTITLTGDVTGSGTGSFITTIKNNVNLAGSPTTTTQTAGDSTTNIATTAFVANAILGQDFKEAVKYASTGALPSVVYNNGSSGVGATLTGVALGAINLDGASPIVNDRVLIKNQVSTFQNGIYIVTTTGSGIAVFVLTRSTDFNQPSEIDTGDSVFVTLGTTQSTTTWAVNSIPNPTIGIDPITFAQTAGQGSFIAGNGILITGTSISIDTSVTVDKTTTQTLTNKTLTSPILTSPVLGAASATSIGIGTISPSGIFEVVGTTTGQDIIVSRYSTDTIAGAFISRKARGTIGTPTAILSGDNISVIGGRGYDGTLMTATNTGSAIFTASENWSATAHGTYYAIGTTPNTTTTKLERLRVLDSGFIGIGTTTPSGILNVINTTTTTMRGGMFDQYSGDTLSSRITARKSRGTLLSPTVITTGDSLGSFAGFGYDGTNFIEAGNIIIQSTGTISTGIVAGKVILSTANAAGTITTGITLDSLQNTTFNGGIIYPYVAKTSTYTIDSGTTQDRIIECTSGTFTVTLPTAVGKSGRVYIIKNSGIGFITLNTTSSQTIDGSASLVFGQNVSYTVSSNGSSWIII